MDLILSNTGDAAFRGWGKAISDQLAAFGWVKTADTGQVDWTAVTAPTGTGQVRGYEVWRMNDALQAQAPAFLKIEYGSSGAITAGPGLWLTMGTGSNGGGTLTGQVGARVAPYLYDQPSPTQAYRCIFSGDPGRFAMALAINRDIDIRAMWLDIERSKSAAGADTAEGVFYCGQSVAATWSQFVPMAGPVPPNDNIIACLAPMAVSSSMGQDVQLYPIYPYNARPLNPIRGAAAYYKGDIVQDSVIPVTIYGTTQTFYTAGHQVYGPMLRVGQAYQGVALRYD
jgi:hypothetical protein